jgi:hypothetical protein
MAFGAVWQTPRHDRTGPKSDLHRCLQVAREALLWKLDGLSEYDIRRPLTPTGTNLLGLVKHLAGVEFWYFGDAFGRPPSGPRPWSEEDASNNADMWAAAGESRDQIDGMYQRAWVHSDETIRARRLRVRWVTPLGLFTASIWKRSSSASSPSHSRSPRPSTIGTTTMCA